MDQEGVTEHSGFPNPATDSTLMSLDINKLLIKNPISTFFMKIDGSEWEQYGIFNGDIVIIDRSLNPKTVNIIVYWQESTFTIQKLKDLPIDTEIWGTVTATIHRHLP